MNQRKFDELRAGRKCRTCMWIVARDVSSPREGWCHIKLPPVVDVWGRHNPVRNLDADWCSLWTPNLSEM